VAVRSEMTVCCIRHDASVHGSADLEIGLYSGCNGFTL
jgi:hypothetical protein